MTGDPEAMAARGFDGDVRVVQLPHPGGEHRMPSSGLRPWMPGTADHARTFIQSPAIYRASADGRDQRGNVVFWGEWEGAVECIRELEKPATGWPRWLCRPDLTGAEPESTDTNPPQNTDPFVWGDAIRYTFCRQPRNRKLRRLGRGSLILFGSSSKRGFELDTVLVVREWIEHANRSDLVGRVDDTFRRWTIDPMYGWGEDKRTYRLYLGATPDEEVDGMFSFVPARPAPTGFPRPVLELEDVINPNLRMQARVVDMGLDGAKAVWDRVVEQVLADKLVLATRLELPGS